MWVDVSLHGITSLAQFINEWKCEILNASPLDLPQLMMMHGP